MAKLVNIAEATHAFQAVGTKQGEPSEHFLYYVIEGNETGHMTIKDAVREIEEEGWFIKTSSTRPIKDKAAETKAANARLGSEMFRF